MTKVGSGKESDFLIRSSGRHGCVHEPRISEGMAVLHRRILPAKDYVLAVQGGCHLQKRQAVSHFLHRCGIVHHTVDLTDLRHYVLLDKVLITLHLDRAVATDCLVVIARNRVIEGIYAYIQNAEIRIFVLKYHLIDRTRVVGSGEVARSYEMILVEISLAD